MNGFYKVKSNNYSDIVECSGVVFGEDEAGI